MIPSIAITAYLLDLDYEHIKTFYYKHIALCEKYEYFFQKDYDRYLKILDFIKKTNIMQTISDKYTDINFNINVKTNPISYDKFINMYISNIIKYKGLIINKSDLSKSIFYNIDFFNCNIESEDITNKIIDDIRNELSVNSDIDHIDFISNVNRYMYSNIYMRSSFNVENFIKLINDLKNIYNKDIRNVK